MDSALYTWGGLYFGKREGDSLVTFTGVEAGRFHGDEVYGPDGAYLGELRSGKLITDRSKSTRRKEPFTPRPNRVGHVGYVGHVGTVMLAGFEDFPSPATFQ